MREKERPLRGRAERGVPELLVDVVDATRDEPVGRCVHEQVEAAELADRALHHGPRTFGACQIAVAPPHGDDRCSLGTEARRDCGSDAACAAGDKGAHVRALIARRTFSLGPASS